MNYVVAPERYAGSFTLRLPYTFHNEETIQQPGAVNELVIPNCFGQAEPPNSMTYWSITGLYIPTLLVSSYHKKETTETLAAAYARAKLELLVGGDPAYIAQEAQEQRIAGANILWRMANIAFTQTLQQPIPVFPGNTLSLKLRYSFQGYNSNGIMMETSARLATVGAESGATLSPESVETVVVPAILRYDIYKTSGIKEL